MDLHGGQSNYFTFNLQATETIKLGRIEHETVADSQFILRDLYSTYLTWSQIKYGVTEDRALITQTLLTKLPAIIEEHPVKRAREVARLIVEIKKVCSHIRNGLLFISTLERNRQSR